MMLRRRQTWLLVGLLVAALAAVQVLLGRGLLSAKEDLQIQKLRIFSEALDYVEKNYVKEVDLSDLVHGAIGGMLNSLDAHSSFMSKDVYQEVQIETSGQFGGLGMEITMQDGVLTVVSPIEDTPAHRAGIQAGDRILQIDGESTANMSLAEALKKLRGPKGSKVTLVIHREGLEEPETVAITRDLIHLQSVRWADLGEGYGYLRIRSFQDATAEDLDKALKELEKAHPQPEGVILDLRNNPGGLLEEAVSVSDLFLESGDIVSIKGRRVSRKVFTAKQEGTHPPFLMIVLVNKGTASASEIVATALRDHDRALLMGARTFGKGSVQTIVPLSDGSAIRVTTAYYYTPKEVSLQDNGVLPDVPVDEKELYSRPAPQTEQGEAKLQAPRRYDPGQDPMVKQALALLKSWEIFSKTLKKPS
ncbi:MAG: S41 family peptidase [Nitrospirae bacterium]|nr:S41 family peptidase [Nitrospirota bacterium]